VVSVCTAFYRVKKLHSALPAYLCVLYGCRAINAALPTSLNSVNPLRFSGYLMYCRVFNTPILRSAHTVYLCVLCGSENKQRLFPYTA